MKNAIIAGIDVGSHSLKMKVAEVNKKGVSKELENLRVPIKLGKEVFSDGNVSFETIEKTIKILNGFKEIMKDYRVDSYRAIATSAIREADNRDYIINQIKIATNLNIEVLSNSETKYMTYRAVMQGIDKYKALRKHGTLMVDIGAGSSELSIYFNGDLVFSQSIRIGSLRIKEVLFSLEKRTLDFPQIIEEYVESSLYGFKIFKEKFELNHFIAIGGGTEIILKICDGKEDNKIDKKEFIKIYEEIKYMDTYSIAEKFEISFEKAETLLPSMIIYKKLLNMTEAEELHIPLVSLRDGIISDIQSRIYLKKDKFREDILSAARHIAKRYSCDKKHYEDVETKALEIFDAMQNIHGLEDDHRFLLRISCILHDLGKYINLIDHQINSYRVIISSNLIGVSQKELKLIACICRYHSYEDPKRYHEMYKELSEEDRILVSKLSSIIKIANAMDKSHKQRIGKLSIKRYKDKIIIEAESKQDCLLEEWSFEKKSKLFFEIFGIEAVLKIKRRV